MAEFDDDDLDAIEARARDATPGPWEAFVEGRDHLAGADLIRTGGMDESGPDMYVTLTYWNDDGAVPAAPHDLDFIAAARQDIPRLVAELRRMRELHPPQPVQRADVSSGSVC